jgi:hypothetical protein
MLDVNSIELKRNLLYKFNNVSYNSKCLYHNLNYLLLVQNLDKEIIFIVL